MNGNCQYCGDPIVGKLMGRRRKYCTSAHMRAHHYEYRDISAAEIEKRFAREKARLHYERLLAQR